MKKKAWSGRFAAAENPLMEAFNASIFFDKRLFEQDIDGSLAHAAMLKKIGILKADELTKIQTGLQRVREEIRAGNFAFEAAQEDIHMAVETRLTELIGPLGGKLHSARSRNDQVALDCRLYVRHKTEDVLKLIRKVQKEFVSQAQQHIKTVMPGYTHLQRAQPILLAHHLLAYFEMLERDHSRFSDNLKRLDQCPLGAGALAGSPIPIDRHLTATKLGFSEPTHNSMDTVADRDFVLDFLSSSATLMLHLSRFAEELVLWSSQEFGFVQLSQGFCTGSSMMPQKVNPDAPELIRGKTGRVYGNLVSLLTTMKALPLCYNKDMQEDKEPLFDTADTIIMCLSVLAAMLPGLVFDVKKMRQATKEGFLAATDLADYLARKGLPFREAHEVVGKLVQLAQEKGIGLDDIDLPTFKKASLLIQKDIYEVLSIEACVNARISVGGTATKNVQIELKRASKILGKRD